MSKALRIGIAGLGTVGASLVTIIQTHAEIMAQRCGGCTVEISCVSALDKAAVPVDVSGYDWGDDALDLAARDDVDVVVELIGGSSGIAFDLAKASLANGKSFVTANKAMLAHHGAELAELAEKNNVTLAYEAAVAGGIPVIRALRDGLAANRVTAIHGILNGTCNYILTEMRESGRDFADVLKDAQDKGYAESDPTFDIEGIDASHKICLLAALGYGVRPNFEAVQTRGITEITSADIEYAESRGYRIKLIGTAVMQDGQLFQSVEPCLVSKEAALGGIEGVINAVSIDGDFCATHVMSGPGAGGDATASAVMSDIMGLARGEAHDAFGVPVRDLQVVQASDASLARLLGVMDDHLEMAVLK